MISTPKLRQFVLASVSDDYEEVEMIRSDILKMAEPGSSVQPEEIVSTLADLVREGCVDVYRLYSLPPYKERVPFDAAQVSELYFLITDRGIELLEKYRAEGNSDYWERA